MILLENTMTFGSDLGFIQIARTPFVLSFLPCEAPAGAGGPPGALGRRAEPAGPALGEGAAGAHR